MATKSILKSIHIKDRKSASRLLDALEYARDVRPKKATLGRPYREADKKEIKTIFGERTK